MEEMMLAVEAATTPVVQAWMNWMVFIFLVSIAFVWNRVGARYTLGAFVLGAVAALVVFNITKDPHMLGISHILFWMPLLWVLYRVDISKSTFSWKSAYGIWMALLIITILVSLVFDFRDLAMRIF